ncbi:hypothetical protein J5Y04_24275 [Kitasatospora sp. RG8]|uniref:hypothetical protein n=1 Tax=Kitasatospora sp. RG8 TaxID=2820815 RepID=UPI001ADEE4F8|nr:hypothetical protein [Kitasatospora sp. RG8]MBP0452635.1 hypothetical protein [Kitasatospora sp. RG8]
MSHVNESSTAALTSETWTPEVGEEVALVKTGEMVRIMFVHTFGVFVRPLRGGREQITRVRDLVPPEDAPGGFNDWQASRG